MSMPPVHTVEVNAISGQHALHKPSQIALRCLDYQMDMVAHQAIQIDAHTEPLGRLAYPRNVILSSKG